MRRFLTNLTFFVVLGFAVFWFITRPESFADDALAGLTADTSRGETVFHAAGCASCHTAPGVDSKGAPVLSGGQRFPSDFGTFIAPNISSDPTHGIGEWSALDLANAMKFGTSPDGQHYYPAFPYTSYARAEVQDIVDLHAYLATLPGDATPSQPHEVGFPFNIRLAMGGWKFLFFSDEWTIGAPNEQLERGRYLVEALGHCAECHTPRGPLGNLDNSAWLTGAPDPSGKGRVPDITPQTLGWSEGDLAYYFESGFTPDFDSSGGHMAHVVENLGKLPAQDREAIAAYLIALP
ncbi:cytochrome c [Shimia abyssi]|uniref:Mono/diheme cytochrome c family protein n=1 Tax=Shimia abyssi TaxID=1662395 RepID=A0A2P8F6L4_9RHOB|nr:c-type cytochrome [Shimia abyssi]PSL17355.1 mono/diheme cytochrome c family protein [Shimia abyssi]